MKTNKRRDTLVGLAVFILIILLAIFLVRRHQEAVSLVNNSPVPTSVSVYQQQLQNNFGIVVPDTAIKADLKDVSGGNQMGFTTLDKATGQNVYTGLAN